MKESPFEYVELARWQVNYAREEAQRREDEARLYKMRNGTTATVGLPAHEADLVGTLCELAVSIATGLSERFFERYDPHAADVGPIEVRGRKLGSAYHDVRVYKTDIEKAKFIVGASIMKQDEDALVRLNGWAFTAEAYANATDAPFPPHPVKGQARHHSAALLRPMSTLVYELPQEAKDEFLTR
jgi:hypothetical protein